MSERTDRELLELAAKAAGWSCWKSKHGYLNVTAPGGDKATACHDWPAFDSHTGEKIHEPTLADALCEIGWNPLEDDDDALRLAVELGITVGPSTGRPDYCIAEGPSRRAMTPYFMEAYGDEPAGATRRAIVRAAAEIGANMQS